MYSYNYARFWLILTYIMFELINHLTENLFYNIERCLKLLKIRSKNKLYIFNPSLLSIILKFQFSWGLNI